MLIYKLLISLLDKLIIYQNAKKEYYLLYHLEKTLIRSLYLFILLY